MRLLAAPLVALTLLACACAQPVGKDKEKEKDKGKDTGKAAPATRFGIDPDLDRYPQKTPQLALASVLRAVGDNRVDYLVAHLADPAFVQARLKVLKGGMPAALAEESRDVLAFQRLVKATAEHFKDDPTRLKELTRFAKDGEWNDADNVAVATLKVLPARKVYFKKLNDRWYLQDRDK